MINDYIQKSELHYLNFLGCYRPKILFDVTIEQSSDAYRRFDDLHNTSFQKFEMKILDLLFDLTKFAKTINIEN